MKAVAISDLGTQCHTSNVSAWTLGWGDDGSAVAWLALGGARSHPSWLVGVDPDTGRLVEQVPIHDMTGPKSVVQAPDGTVFVGGYHQGALFAYTPGDYETTNLGLPFSQTEFILSLLADDSGIYGGTWPNGAAFRWTAESGFSAFGSYPIREGHQWLRCLARDDRTGGFILGSGTPGAWTLYDPDATIETPLELPVRRRQTFAYAVTARSGVALLIGGDTAWVVNLARESGQLTADLWYQIEDVQPIGGVITDAAKGQVALWQDGTIISCLPNGKTELESARPARAAVRLNYAPEKQSLLYASPESITAISVQQPGRQTIVEFDQSLPQSPQTTSALTVGADGRIYSGGFLSGGLGIYDPRTGSHSEAGPISQPEVIAAWGDDLLVGSYPGARLQLLTQQDLGEHPLSINDTLSFHDQGQDRPYAFAALNDDVAYVGFMADYGSLDGGIVRVARHGDAPPGHRLSASKVFLPAGARSVIGLCTMRVDGNAETSVFGTTKIDGGMGISPTEERAVLFALSPKSGQITTWHPPAENCRAIFSPVPFDGRIWMIVEDELMWFDPAHGRWEGFPVQALQHAQRQSDHRFHAHEAMLRRHPSGTLLMCLADSGVAELNPRTGNNQLLWDGPARHLSVTEMGDVYFVDATNLSLIQLRPTAADSSSS